MPERRALSSSRSTIIRSGSGVAAAATTTITSMFATGGRTSSLRRGSTFKIQPCSSPSPGLSSTLSPTLGFVRSRRSLPWARSVCTVPSPSRA